MTSKKKENELRKAALDGDLETIRSCVASGVNVDAPHAKDGQTALMYASANGHVEVIKFLLASGAKIEATDNFVFTALMIASTQGELDSIEVLLAAGANLDAKDKFGKTALDKARQCGHADAVKLLESGPSVAGSSSKNEAPTKKVKTGPLKQGWREIIDDEGDSYYWNDATGESTWEAPLA